MKQMYIFPKQGTNTQLYIHKVQKKIQIKLVVDPFGNEMDIAKGKKISVNLIPNMLKFLPDSLL